MRIISGEYKGRRIRPPATLLLRPTTDYAKESLFNVLNNMIDFSETRVLDLFAGTGNISFEFASRGCPEILAIDIERRCVDFINTTAKALGMSALSAYRVNTWVFLKKVHGNFDLVFADPPYEIKELEKLPGLILSSGVLNPSGLLVLEHSDAYSFTGNPFFDQLREYGKVCFSIFRLSRDEQEVQYSSS